MNNEIKEILDKLNEDKDYDDYVDYKGSYFKPLLDYITNLQEENERLKIEKQEVYNCFNLMAKFRDKALERTFIYKSRCEKAIYYIWKEIEQEYDEENNKWLKEKIDNLLNILNGGDDNEKFNA